MSKMAMQSDIRRAFNTFEKSYNLANPGRPLSGQARSSAWPAFKESIASLRGYEIKATKQSKAAANDGAYASLKSELEALGFTPDPQSDLDKRLEHAQLTALDDFTFNGKHHKGKKLSLESLDHDLDELNSTNHQNRIIGLAENSTLSIKPSAKARRSPRRKPTLNSVQK